jgi:hypothetical protein
MTSYEVRCTIDATPDRVWARLTDGAALVAGGLGLVRLEGTIARGATLTLWSEASPGRAFVVRVAEFTPPRRMVWEGGLPFGLFKGVRQFDLTPSDGRTAFHMREAFGGLLAPLIGRSIPDLTPSFEKFAHGLRTLAEDRPR